MIISLSSSEVEVEDSMRWERGRVVVELSDGLRFKTPDQEERFILFLEEARVVVGGWTFMQAILRFRVDAKELRC